MVTKHDGENGLPQGDATLEGAEFTIEYYDTLDYGDYDALKVAGITPLRTWVIATDGGGQASLDDAHLVSGDDLYRNADGQAVLPRGTIVVYESHPSEGYLLNEGFHSFQKIQEQPMENTVTYQTPEAPEQVIRGGVEVHKHDQESDLNTPLGGASLDGTVFEVRTTSEQPVIVDGETYNKGEVVATLTIKDGYAATATDALPYGSYTLQETHVGEGYLLTDTTVYPFTIRENGVLVNPVTGTGMSIIRSTRRLRVQQEDRRQRRHPRLCALQTHQRHHGGSPCHRHRRQRVFQLRVLVESPHAEHQRQRLGAG